MGASLYRIRISKHLLVLMLINLLPVNSSQWDTTCEEYLTKIYEKVPGCTLNESLKNTSACVYSTNDLLQLSDLTSLIVKNRTIPGPPEKLTIKVIYINTTGKHLCAPTLEFIWRFSYDNSCLSGFALNITYLINNENRQKIRIFKVKNETMLTNNTYFTYQYSMAIPGMVYAAKIYSLPTDSRNFIAQNISIPCTIPHVHKECVHTWRAQMAVSKYSNGSMKVYFMPAPINFNYSSYRLTLSPQNNIETVILNQIINTSCPREGQAIVYSVSNKQNHTFYLQLYRCDECFLTSYIVSAQAELNVTQSVTVPKPSAKRSPNKNMAIGLIPAVLVILAFCLILCAVVIWQKRSGCLKCGSTARKTLVILICSNDADRYSEFLSSLSSFFEAHFKYKVIFSYKCKDKQQLKENISVANKVLIFSSEEAFKLYNLAECDLNESTDHDTFVCAIKLIKDEFKTAAARRKFCQIILPWCNCRSANILFDLKVAKSYKLSEYIIELRKNFTRTLNVYGVSKRYQNNQLLNELAVTVNDMKCDNKETQHYRNICQRFKHCQCKVNDSRIPCDSLKDKIDYASYFSSHGCDGMHSMETKKISQEEFLGLIQVVNAAGSNRKVILQDSKDPKVDISIDDIAFHEPVSSSLSSLSLSCFKIMAKELNEDFDRNVKLSQYANTFDSL